ncbi:hypothetical protein ASF71_16385 [Deinococcus sp. Leaf326]|nr:hypothetical protein ASF71_16385 [Deinococcus sp. Leaf326]
MMTTIPGSKPIMLVNGVPIYPQEERTTPVTEAEVEQLALTLTGSAQSAHAWMDRPNVTLRGQTPREAVRAGQGQRAVGILQAF